MVPADISSASGQDSDSDSDTLYRLATDYDSDESDMRSDDDDQLLQITDQSSILFRAVTLTWLPTVMLKKAYGRSSGCIL